METAELRPLILEILRRFPSTQYYELEKKLNDAASEYRSRDDVLKMLDILWELLIQGVLAPGLDAQNPGLPFIHVTDYGKRCLDQDAILPHDPDGYLDRLQKRVGGALDEIVLTYVRESLFCFLAGHYLAATVMLGVASERCIDLLIEAHQGGIEDSVKKEDFTKEIGRAGRSVKRRFDALREELKSLSLTRDLKDALDIQLSGIFTLIRYSRNDAGHPTERMVDRDTAYGNLLVFPQYCERVYDLIAHFQSQPP